MLIFKGLSAAWWAETAATVRALREALGKGLPRARLLLAAVGEWGKGKKNRSRYESYYPPTPAREGAADGRARCPVKPGMTYKKLREKAQRLGVLGMCL